MNTNIDRPQQLVSEQSVTKPGLPQGNPRMPKFLGVAIIFLAVTIGYITLASFQRWFPFKPSKIAVSTPTPSPTSPATPTPTAVVPIPTSTVEWENIDREVILSRGGEDYILETTWYPEEKKGQKLLLRNKTTGVEQVIIPSLKESIPALGDRLFLVKFAIPQDENIIIFKSILPDTDNPGGELYSFNLISRQFKFMKVNDIYDGFFGGYALSPDERRFIWAPPVGEEGMSNKMYLINLVDDSYKLVVSLTGNETFNGGGYAMTSVFKIKWVTNNKIEYAVFDQSKKVGDWLTIDPKTGERLSSAFIANRELNI